MLTTACRPEARPLRLEARTAADLMSPNPLSISDGATARGAAEFLTARRLTAAPVTNEAGAPVGVLSQTDLVVHFREQVGFVACRAHDEEAVGPGADAPAWRRSDVEVEAVPDPTRVRDLMTPTVFAVRPDAPAAQVIADLLALKVHRLFVTDAGGVLVGVISALDVLRRLRPSA
jgi:CBS-domain-containing membrane protein